MDEDRSECWAELHEDLLEYILKKLDPQVDEYVRFGCVCKSWLHVLTQQKSWQQLMMTTSTKHPLLMIPAKNGERNNRNLYDFMENRILDLTLNLNYTKRCCGSSLGWLATFSQDMVITLRNPISGKCIPLPRIFNESRLEILKKEEFDYSGLIGKVILSDDPELSPQTCTVAVLYDRVGYIAFMKLVGDETWTYVEQSSDIYLMYDILFDHRGNFLYSINDRGQLLRIDLGRTNNKQGGHVSKDEVEVVVPKCFEEQAYRAYLVRSSISGDIIMVRRDVDKIPPDEIDLYLTIGMEVYRLVVEDQGSSAYWVEIKSLNNEVIFVGDSHSICLPCAELPHYYKPNRIYFTDDAYDDGHYDMQGPSDVGAFNMEDATIHTFYTLDPSDKFLPPSIFFTPKLDIYNSLHTCMHGLGSN